MKFRIQLSLLLLPLLVLNSCNQEHIETSYYDNGNISSELHYNDDLLHGESHYYYKNGRLQSIYNYNKGVLEGRTATWHMNENLESEALYKNGQLEGGKKFFSENQIPTIMENYHQDTLHGEYISYHPNGKIRVKGYYKMGLYDSTWIYMDRFGVMVGKAEFSKGSGIQIAYYPNGNKKQVVPFENNEINGIKEFYNTDEKLIKIQVYKKGEFIKETLK